MSVYVSQRNISSQQYVKVINELIPEIIRLTKKFPKTYTFNLSKSLNDVAFSVHDKIMRASTLDKTTLQNRRNLRYKFLLEAYSGLFSLSGLLSITYNTISNSDNVFKSRKKKDYAFSHLANLVNEEIKLIKDLIDEIEKDN